MKRSTFITIFIGGHIIFAGLQIYKQNEFTRLSYRYQKKDHHKAELAKQKSQLIQEQFAQTNHTDIKEFARVHLHMEPVTIGQVKKLSEKHDVTV
jgi:cell division protein FtsL